MKMKDLKAEYLRAKTLWRKAVMQTLCEDFAGRVFNFFIRELIVYDYVSDEFIHIQSVRGSYDTDGYPVIEVQRTNGEWVDTYCISVDEDKIFRSIDWEEL